MILGNGVGVAQTPEAPRAPEQGKERESLARRIQELRSAGQLDEAMAVAERALDLERRAEGASTAGEAQALSRLAELHELRGEWDKALGRRREALAVRQCLDGPDHWRTADARLAVGFADRVAGLAAADRVKVTGALRKEQEAARLETQGNLVEAERVALEAMETYRSLIGPDTAEVARGLHRIGRVRAGRNDPRGAKQANEQALAIRRKVLPREHPDLGRSLNNLGLAESNLGNQRLAREVLEEAVRVWRAALGTSDPLLAMGLFNLGNIQHDLREDAAAKANHLESLAIRRKTRPSNPIAIAESLNNLGMVQRALRDYAAARASHEEALAIRRKALTANHPEIATSLNNLAIVQQAMRDYAAAKASHEESLAIRRKARPSNPAWVANSLNNLGTVEHDLGDNAAAKARYEEALAIRRKALPSGHPDIAQTLNNLGNVQREMRDLAAARASHEEALAIRRKTLPADHPDIAQSLNNLGNVQREMRDLAAAKASHEEALAILRRGLAPNDPGIAASLNHLGVVQEEMGEYAAAKASHEEALRILRKAVAPDDPAIAISLNGLGNVQRDLKEYAAAKASLEEALGIGRKARSPNPTDLADTLSNLSVVQRALGNSEASRAGHTEALLIRRKALPPNHPDIAESLLNLGVVQWQLREYAAAKASYTEALAIHRKALPPNHPKIAQNLDNLANVQFDLGERAAARASQAEALAIFRKALPPNHPDLARSLSVFGWISLASGTGVEEAIPRLAEATDLFQAEQLRLAVAQAEPEQLETAVSARVALRFLIEATLATGTDPGPTYDRVVRVKGSVSAQQRWARQARDAADPETARLLDRLRQVTQRIVGYSVGGRRSDGSSDPQGVPDLLRTLTDQRARLEQQLSTRSAVYRATQSRARIGGGAIRAALPRGTALIDLVDYLHATASDEGQNGSSVEPRVAAFMVRPERPEVAIVPLGPSKDLTALIDRWRSTYAAGTAPAAGAPDPAAELRKRLWDPLAQHLDGVQVVLVSPDGPLNGLPWAALPGSKAGTFLVHEYAFAVVPVPQLLPELLRAEPRRAKESPSLLLAGGIDFGAGDAREPVARDGKLPPVPTFRPLPGTESEVNDLRSQFEDAFPDAPPPRRLSKDKATKPTILAALPSHRFVHLATHGFFADEAEESAVDLAQRAGLLRGGLHLRPEAAGRHPGLLSGLVFAGVNRPDRPPEETILTALEAAELDLGRVELVVLSACQTGRGRVAGGEGVLGLQRAFQLAGARSVLASLWRIPDEETHRLMREFYRRVWSGEPVSKAESLRQAQLWMLNHWEPRRGGLERPAPAGPAPPYVWAAFVLSGDWR
jgi:CHAT domain-containing protein/tetratricopeptide (TPR) repeat protein